ncbi:hypothetical protein AK812_SmicGene12730 [Symbiodinium microadriaticum]|uniref:Uncharacterized protein n=1 Tax=Symbiodinium microadriaticum TaxID=2951 RepID=A0A1Q9E9W2_SYMMI|nr:hypothetical protein AK812_SmicGene12730 [Symbiodinium microadriaticum]
MAIALEVLWLLDHKAEADAANKDGNTPLHFIALVGGRDGLMNEEVEEVQCQAKLSAARGYDLNVLQNVPARSYGAQDKFLQEKLPLEIAAETQYPKELLYLMAALVQGVSRSTDLDSPRAFSDILLLSRCIRAANVLVRFGGNLKVAEEFTRDLVERAKADQGLMDMLVKALGYNLVLCAARTKTVQPKCEVGDIRQDNVYDVDVKALLLPNVLDVDILMALFLG